MDINKKYEQWLNYEGMDASLKAELANDRRTEGRCFL